MKTRYPIIMGILLCLPALLLAEERLLKGQVVLVKEHDETVAVEEGVEVTFKERGDRVRTKAQGLFRLFLPDVYKSGEKITLLVDKSDWRIQYPLEGEVRIPVDLEKELVEIRLLPVGSKKFWSDDRIEKFIQDLAEQTKQQVRLEGSPKDIDFSRYIKDWAAKYGFSPQAAKAEIDKWVAEVQKNQDDLYKLGLAAFAEKNFGKAHDLFQESGNVKAERLEAVRQQEQTLTEETVRDFRLAGDAAYNNYDFAKALASYQRALSYVSKERQPLLWAAAFNDVGRANDELGIRVEGKAAQQHLNEAVAAYRQALEVYTRAQLPQDWATTQNNLGAALQEQGIRTGGEAGQRLLGEAVTAYRQALEVRTRAQLPQDWAMTQNNLGNALSEQGIRTGGEAGQRLLGEAVTAYRQALDVRTRAHLPYDWAQTQANLGKALLVLEDWTGAVVIYAELSRADPDNQEAYETLRFLYSEKLFQFTEAFAIDRQWLERHPDDLAVQANFTEVHLTTGRFAEAKTHLADLLTKPELDPQIRLALQALEIATLLALDEKSALPSKLTALHEAVAAKPDAVGGWTFMGTKHVIGQQAALASQTWLLDMLTAIEQGNSAALLAAIDKGQAAVGSPQQPPRR
ncbi:MAG: tetratricopeptide repeat protein [Candidatus Competibacteraceae bacterium]